MSRSRSALPLAAFGVLALLLVALLAARGTAALPFVAGTDTGLTLRDRFESPRADLARAERLLAALPDAAAGDPRLDEAEALIRQSLAARPLNPFAWHDLAQVAQLRGDRAAALDAYRRSIALGPWEETLALARIDLGIALWSSLDAAERDGLRAQVLWLQPVDAAGLEALAGRSVLHHAVIGSSLAAGS